MFDMVVVSSKDLYAVLLQEYHNSIFKLKKYTKTPEDLPCLNVHAIHCVKWNENCPLCCHGKHTKHHRTVIIHQTLHCEHLSHCTQFRICNQVLWNCNLPDQSSVLSRRTKA